MDNTDYSYSLIRSRRKTVALELRPDGRLVVRAPLRFSEWRIKEFVDAHRQWIDRRRALLSARREQVRTVSDPITPARILQLKKEAEELIPQRAQYYAALMGVTYGRISIRCQKTLWGSCTTRGNLSFNCLLMLCPSEVLDYVVVHELSHRRHMDHSAAFWTEVENVLPDYRSRRAWLKKSGHLLIADMQSHRDNVYNE